MRLVLAEGGGVMAPDQLRAFARSILDRKMRKGWRPEQIQRIEYEAFTGPAHASYLISAGKISVCQEDQYLIRHTDAWAVTFRMADLLREEATQPPALPAQLDLFA
ncbi:hypothetical protein [Stenotrophomonas maltophilia]|uniref:hypothetical protein n=1 Tax=Stenotrophomonas maltophilia TaxID=40324 RepID=UPI0013DAAD0C|nr:hypothetical protein [Stenotrophomonas maltophilia]